MSRSGSYRRSTLHTTSIRVVLPHHSDTCSPSPVTGDGRACHPTTYLHGHIHATVGSGGDQEGLPGHGIEMTGHGIEDADPVTRYHDTVHLHLDGGPYHQSHRYHIHRASTVDGYRETVGMVHTSRWVNSVLVRCIVRGLRCTLGWTSEIVHRTTHEMLCSHG